MVLQSIRALPPYRRANKEISEGTTLAWTLLFRLEGTRRPEKFPKALHSNHGLNSRRTSTEEIPKDPEKSRVGVHHCALHDYNSPNNGASKPKRSAAGGEQKNRTPSVALNPDIACRLQSTRLTALCSGSVRRFGLCPHPASSRAIDRRSPSLQRHQT